MHFLCVSKENCVAILKGEKAFIYNFWDLYLILYFYISNNRKCFPKEIYRVQSTILLS